MHKEFKNILQQLPNSGGVSNDDVAAADDDNNCDISIRRTVKLYDDREIILYKNRKGFYHREDGGPAVIYSNGSQEWYINDKRHRLDGPAIIYFNNKEKWYINGHNITLEVEKWMEQNNITKKYPFDKETKTLFILVFSKYISR